MFSWRRKAPRERRSKKKSPILISKYRTWNGKRPDETSGLRPQMKTLALAAGSSEGGYIDQAEMYSREAHGLRKRLLGHHQDTARSCVQLSDVLVLQGQFDEAWEELDKAFVIQNDILGPDHKITKNTVSKKSDVMDKRGSNPR